MKRKDDFRIVTYFPAWAPERADRLRYDVLTHVIYAFAIPTEEGGLLPLDHAEFAKRLVAEAHERYPDFRGGRRLELEGYPAGAHFC